MIEYHYDGGSVAPIHLEDNTWNPEHRLVREVVCSPYRNREWTFFAISFWDGDAPEWLRSVASLSKGQDSSGLFLRCVPYDLIYPWCCTTLVLCHSFHRKSFAAKRAGQQVLQSFHLAPFTFLCCLHNTRLEPTHGAVGRFPINVMPSFHKVGGCTSLFNRHLLFLLERFIKLACDERPCGSLPACA